MIEKFDPAETVAALRAHGVEGPIRLGIVLGTGLVRTSEDVTEGITIPYEALPGFPKVSVSGQAGSLLVGKLSGRRVAILQGRAHYYETGNANAMRSAFETLKVIGVNTLLLTNSAGAVRSDFYPGSLAVISDHINYAGVNPLLGQMGDGRFVSMVDCYDPRLRKRLKISAQVSGIQIHEGVYMWFSGPSFETPAEIKMARTMGADLVGMSTVPEVLIARHLGLDVIAISAITNMAAGIGGSRPSHGETKSVALSAAVALRRLLAAFVRTLEED